MDCVEGKSSSKVWSSKFCHLKLFWASVRLLNVRSESRLGRRFAQQLAIFDCLCAMECHVYRSVEFWNVHQHSSSLVTVFFLPLDSSLCFAFLSCRNLYIQWMYALCVERRQRWRARCFRIISSLFALQRIICEMNKTRRLKYRRRRPTTAAQVVLNSFWMLFFSLLHQKWSEAARKSRQGEKKEKRNFEFSDSFFFGHSTFVVVFLRFWLLLSSLLSSFAFNLLQTSVFVYSIPQTYYVNFIYTRLARVSRYIREIIQSLLCVHLMPCRVDASELGNWTCFYASKSTILDFQVFFLSSPSPYLCPPYSLLKTQVLCVETTRERDVEDP